MTLACGAGAEVGDAVGAGVEAWVVEVMVRCAWFDVLPVPVIEHAPITTASAKTATRIPARRDNRRSALCLAIIAPPSEASFLKLAFANQDTRSDERNQVIHVTPATACGPPHTPVASGRASYTSALLRRHSVGAPGSAGDPIGPELAGSVFSGVLARSGAAPPSMRARISSLISC